MENKLKKVENAKRMRYKENRIENCKMKQKSVIIEL